MIVKWKDSNEVVIDAPAKVNLFLEVLNRRLDGYHNINSLCQTVSLFDRLSFSVAAEPGISIHLETDVVLTVGPDNLVAMGYRLMQKEFSLRRGLIVRLKKRIPVAAGLAGGSSDGAAAIMACNFLFNLKLGNSQMAALAAALGSDLPFFFSSGQAIVSGRGEIVEDTNLPVDYQMILITPPLAISTAASYKALKRGLTNNRDSFTILSCRTVNDLVKCLYLSGNDFEEIYLRSFPELGSIKDELLEAGALLARMTGSGPTVFGIFKHAPRTKVEKMLGRGEWQVHVVTPISLPGQD